MSNKKLLKQISGTVTGSINSQPDWDFIDYSGQALAAASAGYRTYGIVMAPYATRNEVTSMLEKLGDIFADTKTSDEMVPRGYVTGHYMRGKVTHAFFLATKPTDYDLFQRVVRLSNVVAIISDPTPPWPMEKRPGESSAVGQKAGGRRRRKAGAEKVAELKIFYMEMDA